MSKWWVITLCLIVVALVEAAEVNPRSGLRDETQAYGFAFLGDLHFDRLEHHDMAWVKTSHPGDIRQIENYSDITKRNSPALLKAVSNALENQKIAPFAIIQVGDFVEGLCGNYDLQVSQFNEAIAFVTPYAGSIPFLITKGNHDITGPGASRAYSDVIVPWLGAQVDAPIRGTSYTIKHANDLFVFFDAYKPDLDWLEKVLIQNPARQVFFIVHEPVVPYNARAQWYVFSRDKERPQREKLISLLGEYHAIVLCGHLHRYSVVRRITENGFFVQLAMNSVVDRRAGDVKLLDGVDAYVPELVDLEPKFDAKTKDARRELLSAEKPFVSYFEMANTSGYGLITVSDKFIDVGVRLRSEQKTWRRLRIDPSTLNITEENSTASE